MEPVRPPLGDPLAEAMFYLGIYFAPGSEGARAVETVRRALDEAQRARAADDDGPVRFAGGRP